MNIEDRLRRLLTDNLPDVPTWSDPVGRIGDGVTRRRRRRRIASAALAISVIMLTSVGVAQVSASRTDHTLRPGDSDVVPWQQKPVNSVTVIRREPRPDSRPCNPSDLTRSAWTEATEPGVVTLLVANNSDTRCTLRGTAMLTGLEQQSSARRQIEARALVTEPEPLGQHPATIDPGEPARIDLRVSDRCSDPAASVVRYLDVEIVTLGRSIPVAQLELPGTCPVEIGQWYVLPPPLYTPFVSASIEAPKAVQRGTQLTYVVTLRNESGNALPLSPCPITVQQISGQTSKNLLNCTDETLGAHQSRRFEMQMWIPADTQLGRNRLSWMAVMGDGRVTVADLATGGTPLVVEE
ncbi:uncharacterized protein DUF4232 [Micromonospora sp. Llam0]|nr:uncharacterized protein DUF4232 [Micromonospora sp. Llam0]